MFSEHRSPISINRIPFRVVQRKANKYDDALQLKWYLLHNSDTITFTHVHQQVRFDDFQNKANIHIMSVLADTIG